MLDGDILVAHLLHFAFRLLQRRRERAGDVGLLVAAGNLGQTADRAVADILSCAQLNAQLFHQLADQAALLGEQGTKQMELLHLRVAAALCELLCALQGFKGFLGETVGIHPNPPPLCSGRKPPGER